MQESNFRGRTGSLGKPWRTLQTVSIALLFSLPFLWPFHYLPLTTFGAEWACAILLCFALLSAGTMAGVSVRAQWPFPFLLISLASVAGLQYVTDRLDYPYSFFGLLIFFSAMLAAYLLGRYLAAAPDRDHAVNTICVGLVVGAGLSVLLQLLQASAVMGIPEYLMTPFLRGPDYGRPYANVAQPNLLALYLALGMLGALYLNRTSSSQFLVRAASFWLALGVALTMSRAGILLLMLLMVAALAPTALRLHRKADSWRVIMLLALGYACGTVLSGLLIVDTVDGVGSAIDRIARSSVSSRLVMWRDALDVIATSPWLGIGVGEYATVHYWTASANDALLGTSNVHNLPLQMAADFGLIGPALLTVFCIWWALSAFRDRIKNAHQVLAATALAVIGLHSLFEWPLWHLYFAVPVAVFVGLGEPTLMRGVAAVRSRLVLPVLGLAGLLSAAVMKADADSINAVTDLVLAERIKGQGFSLETLSELIGATSGTFFGPYAERVFIEVGPQYEHPDEHYLAMSERVLLRLPSPSLIETHISNLYRAGDIDQAIRHVERLRVFAGVRFADHQESLLSEIDGEQPGGARLIKALKAEHAN